MKFKSLVALVIVLLGLGAYLYYGIQKPAEEKDSPAYGRLAQGTLDEISSFEIQTKEGTFSVAKENQRWLMVSPVKDLAAESKILDLIAALKRFKENRVLFSKEELEKEKPDLAQFGLKEPRLKLTYKEPSLTAPFEIRMGAQNPGSTNVYAQVGSTPAVYLASLDLDYLAAQRAEDFREMKLTTVRYENFSNLSLRSKGKETKFQVKDDRWAMTFPYELPVDHEMVRQLAEKVSLVRANKFLGKAPINSPSDTRVLVGFKEGVSDARVVAGDQRPFGLEIQFFKAGKVPTYYAKGDKTPWAQVSQFHYDNLQKSPEDFIKKTFDDFEVQDVKQVKLKVPGSAEITLEKTEAGEWTAQTAKESKAGNRKNIEENLRALRGMRALRFLSLTKPPSVYSLSMTLVLADASSRMFVFELKKDIGTLYTNLGDKAVEYVISPDIVNVDQWKWTFVTATNLEGKTSKEE
jgi:hypothetical protein